MSTAANDVPEAAVDPSTKDLILWAWKIVVWVSRPVGSAIYALISYLSRALLAVIQLIYEPFAFIVAPLVYLAQFIIVCAQAPFKFLARFETLYIYLGIGALVGVTGGFVLSFTYGLLQAALGIKPSTDTEPNGRTAKQYREQKQKEQERPDSSVLTRSLDSLSPSYSSMSDKAGKSGKKRGVLNQTIVEETDSD